MTREEEICNSIKDLGIGGYTYNDLLTNNEYSADDIQYAFIEGAEWADNHPKSPWISVKDDLPCNHEELMTKDDKGRPETKRVIIRYIEESLRGNKYIRYSSCKMSQWDGSGKYLWHVSEDCITHWMSIPKLPKE